LGVAMSSSLGTKLHQNLQIAVTLMSQQASSSLNKRQDQLDEPGSGPQPHYCRSGKPKKISHRHSQVL
jgi:hypothetical protein